MDKHLNRLLKEEAYNMPEPSQAHLDETVRLCRRAYAARRPMRRIGTLELIAGQLRFVARPIWTMQAAVLLVMGYALHMAAVSDHAARHVPAFLSLTAVLFAMTLLPFYGRARRYKMRELESAARISYARLILAKLCAVGAGDAVCLSAVTALSLGTLTEPLHAVLVYTVLPFLLTCSGSLFLLNRLREEYGVFVSAGLGMGIGVTYWELAVRNHGLLKRVPMACAAAACALLLLALALECRRLARQIPAPDLRGAL